MPNHPPTVSKTVPSHHFKMDFHAPDLAKAWKDFLISFRIYLTAHDLDNEEDRRKVAILLNIMGPDALPIFNSFDLKLESTPLTTLVQRFEAYFTPKVNPTIERHKLFNRKQGIDEDLETYPTALKNISLQCAFDALADEITRDIFSWNLNSECTFIKERILMEKPKTFEDAVQLAKTMRNNKIDTRTITQGINNEMVARIHSSGQNRQSKSQSHRRLGSSNQSRSSSRPQGNCNKCGQVHRVRCPEVGVTCKSCGKRNHFAIMCHSRRQNNVNVVSVETTTGQNNSEYMPDCTYFLGSLFLTNNVNTVNPFETQLNINNSQVKFLLDTGADTNIISFNAYKALKFPLTLLKKSEHKLSTFSGELLPSVDNNINK
ncbi:unnamed protein product, partial [Brenthis ino]